MILLELSHDPAANLANHVIMTRLRPNLQSFALIVAASTLAGCATVPMPDLGQNLANFRDNLDDLDKDFMQAEELQAIPTDVRSAREWDQAARDMQRLRDGFQTPPLDPSLTDAEFNAQFQNAQDYADAYKDDDPQ